MIDVPVHVRIKSFNRPRRLLNLLRDVHQQRFAGLEVIVFDDASSVSMDEPRALCAAAEWTWVHADDNHGKRKAWHWTNCIFASLRHIAPEAVVFFIDDDMRLCDRFFERAIEAWNEVRHPAKATLHLMVDSSRERRTCWTGVKARKISTGIRQIQWVDGTFMCGRRMLETLEWHVKPISPRRWKGAPTMSTGVGQQISERLHRDGHGLYQTQNSLVVHAAAEESNYNPKERAQTPMRAVRFVDGDVKAKRMMRLDQVQCSLASIPKRRIQLGKVVKLLLPQVDVLRVYLNGYADGDVPPILMSHPRIDVARSQEHGDRGDAGKFFWCEEGDGYQFTCDDDIHYPRDYVDRMLRALDRYHNGAVVGLHGVTLKADIRSYYQDRNVVHFSVQLGHDQPRHLLGTGCIAYHADCISLRRSDFEAPNMADIWLALAAQKQRVPMIAVARTPHWLKPMLTDDEGLYKTSKRDDSAQTAAINRLEKWQLHKVPSTNIRKGIKQ